MIADSFPPLSKSQIETEIGRMVDASALLRRHPLNIEHVVQDYCDASIECVYGLLEFGVEGCVCRNQNQGKKYRVLVDSSIADSPNENRFRILLGEEVGHIVLHQPLINTVRTEEEFRELHTRQEWLQIEREARFFSRAFFMPRRSCLSTFSRQYELAVDRYGFANYEQVLNAIYSNVASIYRIPVCEVRMRANELTDDVASCILGSFGVRSLRLLDMSELSTAGAVTEQRSATQLALFEKEAL